MLTCRNLIGCPRTSVLPLETTIRGSRTKEYPLPSAHDPKIRGVELHFGTPVDGRRHASRVGAPRDALGNPPHEGSRLEMPNASCDACGEAEACACASNARTDARGARARRVTQGENLFTLECAFARDNAARGDGLGKKSQSSDVSFIRRHPKGIGRMGTRGVRVRAREARRGVNRCE